VVCDGIASWPGSAPPRWGGSAHRATLVAVAPSRPLASAVPRPRGAGPLSYGERPKVVDATGGCRATGGPGPDAWRMTARVGEGAGPPVERPAGRPCTDRRAPSDGPRSLAAGTVHLWRMRAQKGANPGARRVVFIGGER
jgi:hypothetical protein